MGHRPYVEEVGHGLKGIMVGRISESRTLFYRGHEINMAGFSEEVSINIDHFYLLHWLCDFKPTGQVGVGSGLAAGSFLTLNLTSQTS